MNAGPLKAQGGRGGATGDSARARAAFVSQSGHQPTDLFVTFSDEDFRLGFSAAQTTLGAVARLVEARIVR